MNRIEFERLLDLSLTYGISTEHEKQVLIQRANEAGITLEELQIMIDTKMQEKQSMNQNEQNATNHNQIHVPPFSTALNITNIKEDKHNKCKYCGAPLDTYSSRCPQCGAEVENGKNPYEKDIEVIAENLSASQSVAEQINIIKNSVIPISKAGPIEFSIFVHNQFSAVSDEFHISLKEKKKIRNAWLAKALEIRNKANLVLKNDAKSRATVNNMINEIYKLNESFKRNSIIFFFLRYGALIIALFLMNIGLLCESDNIGMSGTLLLFIGIMVPFFVKEKRVSSFLRL